jgi:uncharacterized membrane protein
MNKLLIAMMIVALAGLADASYLTVKHYTGSAIGCTIFHGCDQVTTSKYSVVAGVPVALFGALYYLVMLILLTAGLTTGQQTTIKWVALLTWAGLLASLYLLYLQAFVLHAYCIYCLGSVLTSMLLFIFGLVLSRKIGQLSRPQ